MGASTASRLQKALVAIPFTAVKLEDDFFAPRIETNRRVTIEACLRKCEATGRIRNFAVAGGVVEGQHAGELYNDSDVYKVLEGIAYSLATHPDRELEARADAIIEQIAAAQQADGYLNTYFTLVAPGERWKDMAHGHELYCAGHLIEAAVAYGQSTGKKRLLDVATRFADAIDREFGPGRRLDPCGHPEIELALVRLAHATGEERYARLARFFVDQRGSTAGRTRFGEYAQDHAPVREQREIVGHAVRAMYLYAGMADVAAYFQDATLLAPLEAIWHDVVERKMYVTGGIGSSASNEGISVAYDLPNETAYCETCASIGMALWNQRMFLLTREAQYADVLEKELYNAIPAGVSLAGDRFFYSNPLASRGDRHRVPWFKTSCCPTNLVRYLPAIGERAYAQEGRDVYVALYVEGEARLEIEGVPVRLRQETSYPAHLRSEIRVEVAQPCRFALHLRKPGWARGFEAWDPDRKAWMGERDPPANAYASKWHVIDRTWSSGDQVEIRFDYREPPAVAQGTTRWNRVQRVTADPRVSADQDRIAFQKGPVVYAFEACDHGGHVRQLYEIAGPYEGDEPSLLDDGALFEPMPVVPHGIGVIRVGGRARALVPPAAPYGDPVALTAVPYCVWDNREPGEMLVWLPTTFDLARAPGEEGSPDAGASDE